MRKWPIPAHGMSGCRAADDVEYIRSGGLLLQGFAQFIEQPRIFVGRDVLLLKRLVYSGR